MDFKLKCKVCLKLLLEYILGFGLVIGIFCVFSFNFNLLACDHSGCGLEKDRRKKKREKNESQEQLFHCQGSLFCELQNLFSYFFHGQLFSW